MENSNSISNELFECGGLTFLRSVFSNAIEVCGSFASTIEKKVVIEIKEYVMYLFRNREEPAEHINIYIRKKMIDYSLFLLDLSINMKRKDPFLGKSFCKILEMVRGFVNPYSGIMRIA